MNSKRAIILAGGKGTRLRPFTVVFPKPLMPIGEYPILEIIIRQLAKSGFLHITLAVNHQAKLIETFFGDGSAWGVKIDYSLEDIPLGTMGPLKLINDLPSDFLVMNGDILTDLNYAHIFEEHKKDDAIFSISSTKRYLHSEYGVLHFGTDSVLTGFQEKPVVPYDVSMGIYMLNKEVLNYIPANTPMGFDQLMLKLINIGERVKVRQFAGNWLDIGREEDYRKAVEDYELIKDKFLP